MKLFVTLSVALAALAGEASAFDCAKASTEVEKAICADPALKAADDAMTAAYEAVLPKLEKQQQGALKTSQVAWLKLREENCGSTGEYQTRCILEQTQQRTAFLTAKPETGPGLAKPVLPYVMTKAQTATECSADVTMHMFGPGASAGEAAFNDTVSRLIAQTQADFGTRAVEPGYEYDCTWMLNSNISYGSPDLIAAVIDQYVFSGGAHGSYAKIPLVTNLKTGGGYTFADIFPESAKPALIEACTAGVRAEKMKRYQEFGDDAQGMIDGLDEEMKGYAETIATGVGDFSTWLIYADRAEVYFAPYLLGSYAEGEFVCPLPKALLQSKAANGWIVP